VIENPATRDLAQEIDDLSHVQVALIQGIRNLLDLLPNSILHGHDLAVILAEVDRAAAEISDVQPMTAEDAAAAALSLAQAEAYYRAMAEQAKREAGFGSRVVIGDETTHLRAETTAADGVWIAYYFDKSAVVPLASKVEAMRYGVEHHAEVKFVRWGEGV
jgi:hypothetical protein